MTKPNRETMVYILSCELLPLVDGLIDDDSINGIKFKRSLIHLRNKMEDYTRDANDAFERDAEGAKYHEKMVIGFSRIINDLTYEQLFNEKE